MSLEGPVCRLRAVEPCDADAMYIWENDVEVWRVSNTSTPFSRYTLERFIEEQQKCDIYSTRQLRLIIETFDGEAVGAVDLFEFDPQNLRAGIGILVYDREQRGRGYAADALHIVEEYAREVLHLHCIWCNIGVGNVPSISLFEKAGYERVGVKRDWMRTSDGFSDEILLQKILS